MRLTIFQSDKGDCLLLEAGTGNLMLCDGGMEFSYKKWVRDELAALGRDIDLVYVSHVDNDHISGVLRMLEDEAEWRVFDLHQENGDPVAKPAVARPPRIGGILHNAFRDQVTANNKAIENLLVASATSLFATGVPALVGAAAEMEGIAAGIPEALKVSRLVGSDALDIPVNKPPGVAKGQKLLFAGQPGDVFSLGSLNFTLIGPTKKELTKLREGWNNWLNGNADEVKRIRAEMKRRIDEFSSGTLTTSPYDLNDWNGIPPYKGVTAPNVASLMFLVEEDGRTLLLTGDGHQDFILEGLERTGFMPDGHVHLDILKVAHHGSEHNTDVNFARQVSADHYVFCGDGSNSNPEIDVVKIYYASRMGKASVRVFAPEAEDRDFHFWFSTTSDASVPGSTRHKNFRALEAEVVKLQKKAGGRLHLHFNEGASVMLDPAEWA